jgi:hypothetical protein
MKGEWSKDETKLIDYYVVRIKIPVGFSEQSLVVALNTAIQQIAKDRNIDLGSALDWEVNVFRDYQRRE